MSHNQSYDVNEKNFPEHVDKQNDSSPPDGSLKEGALAPISAGQVHRMSGEERAAALRIAQVADPGPPMASYRTFVFTMIVLVVCMCSGDNGFDGTVMSSINSMTQVRASGDSGLERAEKRYSTSRFFGLKAASSKTGIIFVDLTLDIESTAEVPGYLHCRPSRFLPSRFIPPRQDRSSCINVGWKSRPSVSVPPVLHKPN